MSLIIEETNRRVSGGHVLLICRCHECGDTFEIQRRRFLVSKPCGLCNKKKQNAWKPMFEKIKTLEEKIAHLESDLNWALNTIEISEEMMDDFDREMDEGETLETVKEMREKHGLEKTKGIGGK